MKITSKYAKYALFLLVLINGLNFLHRQAIFFLFPLIKNDFSLTDFQLGLLATGFMIVHSLSGLPLGVLSDRWIRKKIISFGIAFWSGATFLAGLSTCFTHLFVSRILLGVGQSSYSPSALSLISDYFPKKSRARAISLFSIGGIVGTGLGFILAGKLGKFFGWQSAFFIIGFPGIILAILAWFLKEPQREFSETSPSNSSLNCNTSKAGFFSLFKIPTLVNIFLGGALLNFSGGALIVWLPTFFTRFRGYDLGSNEVVYAIIGGGVTCLLGVIVGGNLADRFIKRRESGRLIVISLGIFGGVGTGLIALLSNNQTITIFSLFAAAFFSSWTVAPFSTVIHDIVEPRMRGRAIALYLFLIRLGGNAFSPVIIGKLSDIFNLQIALLTLPPLAFLGGLIILRGIKTIEKDMAITT